MINKKILNLSKKIIVYIYKITFQKFYIKLMSNKISLKSVKLCNQIFGANTQLNQKILFNNFEYQSFDCMSLYEGLKKQLEFRNCTTQYLKFKYLNLNELVSTSYKIKPNKNYIQSLKKLKKQCKKYKFTNLFYPIIDTIQKNHSQIWGDNFSENFYIKNQFFIELKKLQKKFDNLAKEFDVIILPDTAYIYNHLLKQTFLKNKKRVLCLGPAHVFYEYKNIYDSEVSVENQLSNIKGYDKNKKNIEKFLKKRFFGTIDNGFKNISFREKKLKKFQNRKVLFLHSFTDANNNAWKNNQTFASHFEWADTTFKELSKSDFKNWYIKIHPETLAVKGKKIPTNNQAYGTKLILEYLLRKYKVPRELIDDCPSSLNILRNQMPIYTNSSTIIMESLCFNYKSFFSGNRFNKYFGIKAHNKNAWIKLLNYETKNNKMKNNNLLKQAKYMLWYQYSKETFLKHICPDRHIAGSDSRYNKMIIAFEYFTKIFNINNKK